MKALRCGLLFFYIHVHIILSHQDLWKLASGLPYCDPKKPRVDARGREVALNSTGPELLELCTKHWGSYNKSLRLDDSLSLNVNQSATSVNSLRLRRVFQLLAANSSFEANVVVFGSSMTAGKAVGGREGAWPGRFMRLWNAHATNASLGRVKVHNLAVGGTSSEYLLHRLAQFLVFLGRAPDMVVLDYDVNDSFLNLWGDTDDERGQLLGTFEVIVRRLLLLPAPGPAVVYLSSATSHKSHGGSIRAHCSEFVHCWQQHAIKAPVLRAYSVRTVSQQRFMWPLWPCPPQRDLMDCHGVHGCHHPAHTAHTLWAELLAHFFLTSLSGTKMVSKSQQGQRERRKELRQEEEQEAEAEAEQEGAAMRALQLRQPWVAPSAPLLDASTCPPGALSTVVDEQSSQILLQRLRSGLPSTPLLRAPRACWQHKVDVEGKTAGWIAENDAHCFNVSSALMLEVRLGARAVVSLTYLETWSTSAGMLRLEVAGINTTTNSRGSNSSSSSSSSGGGGSLDLRLQAMQFHTLAVVETYAKYHDDGHGASLLKHKMVYDAALLRPNTTVVVRLTAVDSNSPEAIGSHRDRYDRQSRRTSPQKVKLVGLTAC